VRIVAFRDFGTVHIEWGRVRGVMYQRWREKSYGEFLPWYEWQLAWMDIPKEV
jgi:hypothetical protein